MAGLKTTLLRALSISVFSVAIAACSGGGSGSTTPPPTGGGGTGGGGTGGGGTGGGCGTHHLQAQTHQRMSPYSSPVRSGHWR